MDSRASQPTSPVSPVTPAPPSPPQSAPPRPARPGDRGGRVTGWRSIDILRAAALVFGLYLTLRLLWLAYPLLFTAFLGVLFGLAVARGADFLERFRIPRGIGSSLIVFGFLGALAGVGALVAPSLRAQAGELRTALPEAVNRVEDWVNRRGNGVIGQLMSEAPAAPAPATTPPESSAPSSETGKPGGAAKLPATLSGQLGSVASYLFSFLSSTVAVLSGFLLILFMSIYIGSEPDLYHRGLLHLFPHRVRPRAHEVLTAIGVTLRRWLVSQLVAMVVIGVVTTIVLSLLGVRAALALGLIAGLLEFIPLVGPLLSAVPAIAMGFLDSPQKALFVVIAYWGIQLLENHILIPILMREGLDLPPVVTLIGLAIMAVVFGFLGMLVAVPVLAAVMVAIKMLYVEGVVGDDMQTAPDSA
jgi:predicted PurR-regulated permease PerM